jgi:ribonuclease P protein subunit RPR2
MGKKNKDEAPKPNNVLNRDILQRLNFLYQASVCMESISRQCSRGPTLDLEGSSEDNSERLVDDLSTQPIAQSSMLITAGTTTTPLPKASGRKRPQEQRKGRVIRASDIGQGYVRAMRLIGQKATVKM